MDLFTSPSERLSRMRRECTVRILPLGGGRREDGARLRSRPGIHHSEAKGSRHRITIGDRNLAIGDRDLAIGDRDLAWKRERSGGSSGLPGNLGTGSPRAMTIKS